MQRRIHSQGDRMRVPDDWLRGTKAEDMMLKLVMHEVRMRWTVLIFTLVFIGIMIPIVFHNSVIAIASIFRQ